jgi:hypothetical protein
MADHLHLGASQGGRRSAGEGVSGDERLLSFEMISFIKYLSAHRIPAGDVSETDSGGGFGTSAHKPNNTIYIG